MDTAFEFRALVTRFESGGQPSVFTDIVTFIKTERVAGYREYTKFADLDGGTRDRDRDGGPRDRDRDGGPQDGSSRDGVPGIGVGCTRDGDPRMVVP